MQEAATWLDRVMNSDNDMLWAYCIGRAAEGMGLMKYVGGPVMDVDPKLNRIENIRGIMAEAHRIYRLITGNYRIEGWT